MARYRRRNRRGNFRKTSYRKRRRRGTPIRKIHISRGGIRL